jgi:hypothetical protein
VDIQAGSARGSCFSVAALPCPRVAASSRFNADRARALTCEAGRLVRELPDGTLCPAISQELNLLGSWPRRTPQKRYRELTHDDEARRGILQSGHLVVSKGVSSRVRSKRENSKRPERFSSGSPDRQRGSLQWRLYFCSARYRPDVWTPCRQRSLQI